MQVNLLHYTPLWVAVKAIRKCHSSEFRSDSTRDTIGPRDKDLIKRIIIMGHESTIEHIYYTFEIKDISRACLQELVRHRIASYSVKSTRFTLHHIKKDRDFDILKGMDGWLNSEIIDNIFNKYCVDVDKSLSAKEKASIVWLLSDIRDELMNGNKSNDQAKYMLPECFKTELVWTINARALRNFLHLRSSSQALLEIRQLAKEVYGILPKEHREVLFFDVIK